jgi:hypothetical protein
MRLGISFSGITDNNGADYVAEFLANAALICGHDLTMVGSKGRPQAQDIPEGLDAIIHSSGFGLTPEIVERWRKRTKVFVWSHNDEVPLFRERLGRVTALVNKHFSYTRLHGFGDHVEYLPLAADQTIYFPIKGCKKRYDVSMIGAGHPWRRQFADQLSKYFPNSKFDFSMSQTHSAINLLYNMTRVVVAPMQDCDQYAPTAVFGCPCRTFDVPAAKTYQIQAYRDGLKDVHSSDLLEVITLPSIRNVEESIPVWVKRIKVLLEQEKMREEMANWAYEQITENHLYTHRLNKMLEFV